MKKNYKINIYIHVSMIGVELDIVYKGVTRCIISYFYYLCITIYVLVFILKVFITMQRSMHILVLAKEFVAIAFKILLIAISKSLWYFHWIDSIHFISGELCEEKLDFCAQNLNPCQHDSKCILTPKGYK